MSFEVWRLSKGSKDSLGLSCTEDGLFLGQTPLLERTERGFAPRTQGEIERLLSRAYGASVSVADRMDGLASVAKALNKGDLCLARIAAVHLRLPEMPDSIAKLGIELQDLIIDLERKDSPLLTKARLRKDDWDPQKHPRLGSPPNPGWFAPADGGGASGGGASKPTDAEKHRVTLPPAPPGKRIDELEDLAEWIANAKPEEAATIRAEIKRQFYDVGDMRGGNALNRALSDALEAGDNVQERQEILNSIDAYTQADPREMAAIEQGLVGGALALPMRRPPLPGTEPQSPHPPIDDPDETKPGIGHNSDGTGYTPSPERHPDWNLGWGARGKNINAARGANMPDNFPVIDRREADGTMVSIKSVDCDAPTYQNPSNLISRLNKYLDQLDEFTDGQIGQSRIHPDDVKGKVLEVVVPKGSISEKQQTAIDFVRERARSRGIGLDMVEY